MKNDMGTAERSYRLKMNPLIPASYRFPFFFSNLRHYNEYGGNFKRYEKKHTHIDPNIST